jgi:hypothetical protein
MAVRSSGDYSPGSDSNDPGSNQGKVMWDLWWTKQHWGRFSPRTSIPLARNYTDCSVLINISGWYNRHLVTTVIVF